MKKPIPSVSALSLSLSVFFVLSFSLAASASPIKKDETVLFFPTQASRTDSGWEAPLHGFIFEPEADGIGRSGFVAALRALLDDDWSQEEKRVFSERVRLFLVDAESDKSVSVDIGGRKALLGPSGSDGHLYGTVELSASAGIEGGWVPFLSDEGRGFRGEVQLVGPEGVSVVSDIDDTIKVTGVRDRRELLANTFLRPFTAVEGMAAAYRKWEARGAVFHYLSGSPWELAGVLTDFLVREGFPKGGFHLRKIDYDPAGVQRLADPPTGLKNEAITALFDRYPRRRFILVGDSGERDPEIYGELARSRPGRVERIWIRDVTGEGRGSPRYAEAFANLPAERWELFSAGGDLPPLPLQGAAP
jgi:phosphatidate phosphatase APP1